jgi:hypothetical protein
MSRAKVEKRTPEQNRKIWALAGEIGFDETLLRDLVERQTGQRSTSALTNRQANALIEEMNRIGGKQPTQTTTGTRRSGMATPEQIHKIRSLERELGWADNPKRLQAFMQKYSGVSRLEWLPLAAAASLIESLKGVLRSEQRRHG